MWGGGRRGGGSERVRGGGNSFVDSVSGRQSGVHSVGAVSALLNDVKNVVGVYVCRVFMGGV